MCGLNYDIKPGMKICDNCRILLSEEKTTEFHIDQSVPRPSVNQKDDDDDFILQDPLATYLSHSLISIDKSPLKKKQFYEI
jgi:hypothetical protein